jgi:hypothetical protein
MTPISPGTGSPPDGVIVIINDPIYYGYYSNLADPGSNPWSS